MLRGEHVRFGIYIQTYTYTFMYIYYIYMLYIYIRIYIYTEIHVCGCLYVQICTHICIYIYMYTYRSLNEPSGRLSAIFVFPCKLDDRLTRMTTLEISFEEFFSHQRCLQLLQNFYANKQDENHEFETERPCQTAKHPVRTLAGSK